MKIYTNLETKEINLLCNMEDIRLLIHSLYELGLNMDNPLQNRANNSALTLEEELQKIYLYKRELNQIYKIHKNL